MNPMHEARETAELLAVIDPMVEREVGVILWGALLGWLAEAGWPKRLADASARLMLAGAIARLSR